MKKIITLFILLLFFASVNSQVLHTIIFSDTNDEKIGQGCSADVSEMTAFGMQLATALDLSSSCVPPIVMRGNSCSKANLEKVLNNFQCSNKDVVLFFYSGHGTRSYNDASEFPQLCLSSNISSEFVPVDLVKNELKKKNPAFLLILTDCCNKPSSSVGTKRDYLFETPMAMGGGATHIREYTSSVLKQMFLSNKGHVMASSSKKGEVSWTYTNGGYFTIGFLDEFANYVNSNRSKYQWEELMQMVSNNVINRSTCQSYASGITLQHPIWQIDLRPFNIHGPSTDIIEDGIRTVLIRLADDRNQSPTNRLAMKWDIRSKWFADDAIVEQSSADGKVVFEHDDIDTYLLHVSTTFNLRNFNILEEKRGANGKITYLKLNEMYVD